MSIYPIRQGRDGMLIEDTPPEVQISKGEASFVAWRSGSYPVGPGSFAAEVKM